MSTTAIDVKAKRRRREALVWLAAFAGLIVTFTLMTVRAARQRKLDTKLIAAASKPGPASGAAVKRLIELGADPDAREGSGGLFDGAGGDTALICAANAGNLPAMRILLDHGADVNARTWNDCTALMRAAAAGPPEAVGLLLSRGANPSLTDREGNKAAEWITKTKGPSPDNDDAMTISLLLRQAQNKPASRPRGPGS